MVKKEGGKKAAKAAYNTSEEAVKAFGLRPNSLVRTPLGLSGTVLGVRYEDASRKETGRVWVRYDNGYEAPLEPKQTAGSLNSLGYRHCAEADSIRAAAAVQEADAAQQEEQRQLVEEVRRLLAAGEPVPEHLLPASMKEPQDKKGKKKEPDKKGKK